MRDIIGRGLAEGGDAQIAVTGLEIGLRDAADLDLGAPQRERQKLVLRRTAHGELDGAAGRPAHAVDGAVEIGAHFDPVDAHDEVAGLHPGLLGGRALKGAQNLHAALLGDDFDANARIGGRPSAGRAPRPCRAPPSP